MSLPFIENRVVLMANENIQTHFCSVRDIQISCQHDLGLKSLFVPLTMLPPVHFDSSHEICGLCLRFFGSKSLNVVSVMAVVSLTKTCNICSEWLNIRII